MGTAGNGVVGVVGAIGTWLSVSAVEVSWVCRDSQLPGCCLLHSTHGCRPTEVLLPASQGGKNLLITRQAWSQTKAPCGGCCFSRIFAVLTHYTFLKKRDEGANTPISRKRAAPFLRDPRFLKTRTPGPVALAAVALTRVSTGKPAHHRRPFQGQSRLVLGAIGSFLEPFSF